MPPVMMGIKQEPVPVKPEVVIKDGKEYERSQQDGELYSKPTIGIIYPPPEVRNIVDRTANFVARNGPDFEVRIRENEADNPKFNFLNPNDPYHAYYKHKLKEYIEGGPPAAVPAQVAPIKELQKASKDAAKEEQAQAAQKAKQAAILEQVIPKEPPPAFEYIIDPPSISSLDLDIVRLTAQFVAKNGKSFLTNLMQREQRNYQFDFLRPQHSMFQYFTRLVEQYTKVLLPPTDLTKKLKDDVNDPWKVLDRVKYRVDWDKYQQREKKKVEDEKERERVSFAQIDWHDFVVVETVNFREEESANLPPPVTKEQLGARLLAQERLEKQADEDKKKRLKKPKKEGGEEEEEGEVDEVEGEEEEKDEDALVEGLDEMDVEDTDEMYKPFVDDMLQEKTDDMEMDDSDDEDHGDKIKEMMKEEEKRRQEAAAMDDMLPPPLPPPTAAGAIRKGYDPKAPKPPPPSAAPTQDKFLISPLTGEKIPVENMATHMKVSLLDPRWKEQNEKVLEEKKQQDQVFAEGVDIGDTLRQLAERRSDIFGIGAEETMIGQKLGEDEQEKRPHKEIWDGHSASMERVTKLAHSNVTLDAQIEQIHRSKGLLPNEEVTKIGPGGTGGPMGQRPPQQPPLPPSSSAAHKTFTLPAPGSSAAPMPPKPAPQPLLSTPPMPAPPSLMSTSIPQPVMPPIPPLRPQTATATSGAPQPPQPLPMSSRGPQPPPLLPPPQGVGLMRTPIMLPPRPTPPGFLPPPMPAMPRPPVMMAQPPQLPQPPPLLIQEDEEPAPKRSKMEGIEANLIPEHDFLRNSNRLPVTFRVQIPDVPEKKPEWNCVGQMLKICMPLTDQCSVIKSRIYEETGMPAGKQKLQLGELFIKDSQSLAYYNFNSGSVVQLQVKERGGRKK